jgi:beta-aspartyl-peptidase (threonine type)
MGLLESGADMEQSIATSLAKLPGTGGPEADGGAIGIRKDGQIGWAHNSPMFAVGLITSEMDEPSVYLRKGEG